MPIQLEQPRFSMSDDGSTLFIELVEAMPPDHEDPVSWVPEFSQVIELTLPKKPNRRPVNTLKT